VDQKRLKYIQKKEYQMDQTLEEFFNSLTGETEAEMPHQVEHLTQDSEPNSTLIESLQLPDLPEEQVYRSSVLLRLERLGQSTPSTMCSGCKGAVWMTQNGSLQAFCRVMNLITWSSDDPTEIEDCDGPSMMAGG
jgi:hypothetical protein